VAIYLAALCDWRDVLDPGERGLLLFLAQSQKTARVAFNRACEVFDSNPMLAKLVRRRTADTIELKNGCDLEIRPASFRGLRGMTAIGVIADEVSVWFDDSGASSNPDVEILAAVRPALSTTGGPLLMISSPHARRGELWEMFRRHHGPDGDLRILVAQGATRDFHPTFPQRTVDRAMERDPGRAAANYLGQFRSDVETYLAREAIEACIVPGVRERGPQWGVSYTAFIDPSGGSADSMTLAIAQREGDRAVLDCIRERKPPFSPEAVVLEFVELLKAYGVVMAQADKYAGGWPTERFRKLGVSYEASAKPKSDIYRDLLPAINSGMVKLLDDDRLINQLVGLERRASRGGRDSIDHPPGAHDDVANAAAGALVNVVPVRATASSSTLATQARARATSSGTSPIKTAASGFGERRPTHAYAHPT
jgi:hypothetical protein